MMRLFPRYDGSSLIEQICGVENLTEAWRKVRSNIQVRQRKQSAGIDAVTLRDFEADWTQQMMTLSDELRSGLYRPLPPRWVKIPKASGSERVIAILAVRDRVAQRAVKQVLEPLFDPFLLDCSFGCRMRVGVPDALVQVVRYAERGLIWVVDADVARYFDTIDHRLLLGMVRQRVDDVRVLQLIARWLEVAALTEEEIEAQNWGVQSGQNAERKAQSGGTLERLNARTLERFAGRGLSVDGQDFFDDPMVDPYAMSPWHRGGLMGVGTPALMDERWWSVFALARPVVSGVQRAWPFVRKVSMHMGGKRLAIAGGVAGALVTSVAVGEMIRRQREKRRGAMQGGALSPLLANIYLHPFDLAITSQGFRMVRFMDDFVIMCATRADAEQAWTLAERQLSTLRLQCNPEKTRIVNYEDGLEFLGQALVPKQRGSRLADGVASFADAAERLKRSGMDAVKRKKR